MFCNVNFMYNQKSASKILQTAENNQNRKV